MSHLSFEGQTKLSYCLECGLKHSQTAKVCMREALQRAEASGANNEGVSEKVRCVVEELSGYENDTDTVDNKKVEELNLNARELRKIIYSSNAEIGGTDLDTLKNFKAMIDNLVDRTYEVRQTEECPTCKIKSDELSIPEDRTPSKSLDEYGREVAEKRLKFLEEIRAAREK